MNVYHGTAIAKLDIGPIKKEEAGIITAYLPEDETFAIFFNNEKWYTFHNTEKWFLDNFKIIQEII